MAATGGRESGGEKLGNEESACAMRELSASAEGVLMTELSEQERARIALIGGLVQGIGGGEKGQTVEQVAKQLGLSESSVKRLMRQWQAEGIAGLVRQVRSDRGEHRVSAEWREYIVKTYREGNRGGRQMSPAQVAVRVAARAAELEEAEYPSRSTVYRVLRLQVQEPLKSRSGEALSVGYSNQVWQADHTRVDVLVVDQSGAVLGRPWLTLVVDSYSRCIMGMHLGMEAPSAALVCLALRHAILPKQYSSSYGLSQNWSSYGIPQCLYSDNGKDFKSQHIEQVALELGINCEQRRYPSEGGIVERPFGTLNSEVFSTLPGYTGSNVSKRPKQAETSARLTLMELEKLLVRYIVDRYNQSLDARSGKQTRQG
jgi:putative transposase